MQILSAITTFWSGEYKVMDLTLQLRDCGSPIKEIFGLE
jgi:hypothetical protein